MSVAMTVECVRKEDGSVVTRITIDGEVTELQPGEELKLSWKVEGSGGGGRGGGLGGGSSHG